MHKEASTGFAGCQHWRGHNGKGTAAHTLPCGKPGAEHEHAGGAKQVVGEDCRDCLQHVHSLP